MNKKIRELACKHEELQQLSELIDHQGKMIGRAFPLIYRQSERLNLNLGKRFGVRKNDLVSISCIDNNATNLPLLVVLSLENIELKTMQFNDYTVNKHEKMLDSKLNESTKQVIRYVLLKQVEESVNSSSSKQVANIKRLINIERKKRSFQSNSSQLALRTATFLMLNLSEEVRITDLSSIMLSNRNSMAKAFKKYFGTTIFNWLREIRLIVAAELLYSTSVNIHQVAQYVGYQDSNNFSTAFKRCFNLPPLRYRKVQTAEVQQSKKRVLISKVESKFYEVS
jgi:AraC-like DNA-binding protein